MLNKQVKIYSVDTNSFLTENENKIMTEIKELENYIKLLKEFTLLNLIEDINNKIITFNSDDKDNVRVYKYGAKSNENKLIENIQLSNFLVKIKNTNTQIKKYKRKADIEIFEQPKYKFDSIEDYILQLKENENRIYIRKYINALISKNKPLLKDKTFKSLMNEIDENYAKMQEVEIETKKGIRKIKKDVGYKAQIKELKQEFNSLIRQNNETRTLSNVSSMEEFKV